MAKFLAYGAASFLIFALMITASQAAVEGADTAAGGGSDSDLQVREITVTARKYEEKLQDVPDAVTAFTAATIDNAGIQSVGDFAALVPNLVFQDGSGFRTGQINLSMRGIGNGQGGWPSVSYLVDGVPADSTDTIQTGSLQDIERIEVLRGPQSALYGFNAIAGAINVITKAPTNDFHTDVRALYGNGDDRQLGGTISGALIPDKVLFRFNADYRDDDGLIRSGSNGIDLDSKLQKQARLTLLLRPVDSLQIDIHGSFDEEHNGAVYEDKLPNASYIDDFNPIYNARRAFPGFDDRQLSQVSVRVQWDAGPFSLVSVSSYSHTDQSLYSSSCYDDPNDPAVPAPDGGAQCLLGEAYGRKATAGQAEDEFYNSLDNLRTETQDLRLQSNPGGPIEWIVGGSVLHRNALDGFDDGDSFLNAPNETLYPDWDVRTDNWWGVYGQLTWKATDRLELAFSGRYDDERYANTAYTNRDVNVVVPVLSVNGTPEDTQYEKGDAFQPKGQISYHFDQDIMGYVTVSRGFRAGYFEDGSFNLPEHTTNYEIGLKTELLDRRLVMNAAVFHIDYSDQQFYAFINMPPYVVPDTIPKTGINGFEYESTAVVSRFVTFGLGLGYLDATVSDGTASPVSPRFDGNATMDATYPVYADWKARLHIDDRYNSSQYLATDDQQPIGAKNFVNLRAGLQNDRWEIMGFAHNLTDRRTATMEGATFAGGYVRYDNEPRSYGVEVKAHF
jgi:iron complex outermembrane recepter protein